MNLDYVKKSFFLKELYSNELDLKGSFISNIDFSYNGPSLLITFHINKIPKKYPEKWKQNCNSFKINFEFSGILDLNFCKWGTNNIIDFQMEYVSGKYDINIFSEEVSLRFKAREILFKTIEPYNI
ncbi:Imm50 family immunity protein [Aureivirga marina]|uniref:Imm50 family immunity protein n=1 Tax=Aureivirga marina TaxID=1182451 RepID=UPI0018C9BBEE|nr:Imm50 family immunity protein [Aureivirga marina]